MTGTLAEYLEGHPESAELLAAIRRAIAAIGPVTEVLSKSQVTFRRDRPVATVWAPGQYLYKGAPLVATFDLPQRNTSTRWKEVVEPRPGRFVHHLELRAACDIDDQVLGWLRAAYGAAGEPPPVVSGDRAARKRRPGPSTLTEADRRVVAVWAADCAERTLPLFETQAPHDRRPRDAVEGVRAFARGELQVGAARHLAAQAHAAARDVGDPVAMAAARAAGHAAAVAHMASHAVGAPAYAALAARLARPDDEDAAADMRRWAVRRASPAVRGVLRRLPPPTRRGGIIGTLVYDLHVALTVDA